MYSIFTLCPWLHFHTWQNIYILQEPGLVGKISDHYSLVVLFSHISNIFSDIFGIMAFLIISKHYYSASVTINESKK